MNNRETPPSPRVFVCRCGQPHHVGAKFVQVHCVGCGRFLLGEELPQSEAADVRRVMETRAREVGAIIDDEYMRSLKRASDEVESWPAWKRGDTRTR